jgi:hypothetical protein
MTADLIVAQPSVRIEKATAPWTGWNLFHSDEYCNTFRTKAEALAASDRIIAARASAIQSITQAEARRESEEAVLAAAADENGEAEERLV